MFSTWMILFRKKHGIDAGALCRPMKNHGFGGFLYHPLNAAFAWHTREMYDDSGEPDALGY